MTTSIKTEFEFLSGTVNSQQNLSYNQYRLYLEMYPNSTNDVDQNVAFERMQYVVENILSHSVFCHEEDVESIMRFASAGIPVLTVPAPGPIDQIIGLTLYAKFASIIEDIYIIGTMDIESLKGNGVRYSYTYDDEEDEFFLDNDEVKWWNDSEPRFVSVTTTEELAEYVPNQSWADLQLAWDGEEEDLELVVELESQVDEATDNIIHLKRIHNTESEPNES